MTKKFNRTFYDQGYLTKDIALSAVACLFRSQRKKDERPTKPSGIITGKKRFGVLELRRARRGGRRQDFHSVESTCSSSFDVTLFIYYRPA